MVYKFIYEPSILWVYNNCTNPMGGVGSHFREVLFSEIWVIKGFYASQTILMKETINVPDLGK